MPRPTNWQHRQWIRDFVYRYTARHGRPPSMGEISRDTGVVPSSVRAHLLALVDAGELVHLGRARRCYAPPEP